MYDAKEKEQEAKRKQLIDRLAERKNMEIEGCMKLMSEIGQKQLSKQMKHDMSMQEFISSKKDHNTNWDYKTKKIKQDHEIQEEEEKKELETSINKRNKELRERGKQARRQLEEYYSKTNQREVQQR